MRVDFNIEKQLESKYLLNKVLNDIKPNSYKEINGFHKYWGKKPTEMLVKIIEELTNEGDIVLDPFLGSGLISKECLNLKRRFIGIDLNPFAVEHTKFVNNLPTYEEYIEAINNIRNDIEDSINSTYKTRSGEVLSHILWEDENIVKIWKKDKNKRVEIDINDYKPYSQEYYSPKNLRNINLFDNSRINTKKSFCINDLISNRNLRNIDILIEAINKQNSKIIPSLLLTLTSSIGQMTKMVFAIENRKNQKSSKIEVGSWAIGYWRPKKHFEINVLNCFISRSEKLTKILKKNKENRQYPYCTDLDKITSLNKLFLVNDDCLNALQKLKDNSIDLIITDPPHGNRIPYLELSELWNSILGTSVNYENEIVISEAKERNKKIEDFNKKMSLFVKESIRVIKPKGHLVLIYNSVHKEQWEFINIIKQQENLSLEYEIPLNYSATSIVQSNRSGSLKSDICLIYKKIKC